MIEEMVKPDFSHLSLSERRRVLADYVREHPRILDQGHINLHVHTNESFSFFLNPTEAVWYAFVEGIEYFGINDHYTIAGHGEFAKACETASRKATFSIEAIAMDDESLIHGRRYNDPDNAGRCYLVGKGVTRALKPGGRGSQVLATMQRAIRQRNRKIVAKLNRYCEDRGIPIILSYREVDMLTPHGNTTERHVVQAFCNKIDRQFPEIDERAQAYSRLTGGTVEEELLSKPAQIQVLVRARLVKSGMPCYVEEDRDAFTSVENLVNLYLEYGAIPIYPLMGNPITEEEEDLELLFLKMDRYRLNALEIIDYRTEIERAARIIDAASHHGLPVFIGTEHNTKEESSLVGPVASYPDFYTYLRRSSNFVIGHQRLMGLCDFGFVYPDGRRRFDDRRKGFSFFEEAGKLEIPRPQLEELKKKSLQERKRYFNV